VDEEISRTKDAYEEDQLRQKLKGTGFAAIFAAVWPVNLSQEEE
jgi:hypothetical protein